MIKVILFLSRLPGVSREEFRTYYETRHAPLAVGLLPTLRAYRRNFVQRESGAGAGAQEVDCITEMYFDDDMESYAKRSADPKFREIIRQDETHFLDHTKTRSFVVEECASDLSGANAAAPSRAS